MSTTLFIRRHIYALPDSTPFSTRSLLCYGSRTAVDKALYRMVKTRFIERLARGVFVRVRRSRMHIGIEEIASVKARAFGKVILPHALNHAVDSGLMPKRHEYVLDTLGYSSSFGTIYTRVRFKKVTPRKFNLGDCPAGKVARCLWQFGKRDCTSELVEKLIRPLNRFQLCDLRESAGYIPAWLNHIFQDAISWRPRHMMTYNEFCPLPAG